MLRGLLLALCARAVIAPAAVAAGDQVFVDPGSPSGGAAAPPFGEGVGPAATSRATRGRSGTRPTARAGSADDAAAGAGAGREPSTRRAPARPATLEAQAAAPDGGIGVTAIIGGFSLAVLGLGAAIGLLLRRRSARAA